MEWYGEEMELIIRGFDAKGRGIGERAAVLNSQVHGVDAHGEDASSDASQTNLPAAWA